MKNCLFVVTNVDRVDAGGPPMGLWLSNLTHPYFELMQVGFESDIASPRGGVTPVDPLSHPASEYNVSRDDIVTQGFLAVVCGAHQVRSQDITMEYFQRLLGEQATIGAARENRVIYAESGFGEEGALDLIARHIIDQDAGEAFFGDRMRMQRDLLSEGAADYIESLLTGSPDHRRA